MTFSFKRQLFLSIVFCAVLVSSAFASGDDDAWRPVNPSELQMKTPQVDPDADAEAIFWEVRLDDRKRDKLFYNHYVRVKIFTERGREKFSKFDIPFMKGKKVEDVAARVIKPDGTIIELQPSDIFERDIIQFGKIRVRAKSFAVPGIEPGVIVEYRYKETFKGDSADGEHLYFQRDIPIQRATYAVRPFKDSTLGFDFHNMPPTRFQQDGDGFYVATLTNVPAFKEEPQMPPDDESRQWVYLSYRNVLSSFSWGFFGRTIGQAFGKIIEPTSDIKRKADELTSGATTQSEKLKRIYDFTQKQIRNISFDPTVSDEQRANFKVKDGDDVLRRAMGSERDIAFLFAALAKAAGFDAHFVLSGDRSENFFNPDRNVGGSYVRPAGVAVELEHDGWVFLNPGVPYLPYGKLFWYQEGVYAMLASSNDFLWKKTLMTDYASSPAKRIGKFKLSEDGTLEGTVRIEYEGHRAISRRQTEYKNSPAKREENIKAELKERMSTAEISELSIENFDDASKPLIYSYKIRVPNYAQKTGKRLFLQPGFFEYGTKPLFSSATRIHPIYFSYAWLDEDNIEIQLPKGFATENAESPGDVIENQKIGALSANIYVDKAANLLKYKRKFFFGAGGNILFPVASYEPLKFLFDNFHKADMHTVTLRQSE
ncbi:MAG TPA: DUF3857 domain-containing protein [Pyrinomonadaceae bacterium]|jgi:hypothetical protein